MCLCTAGRFGNKFKGRNPVGELTTPGVPESGTSVDLGLADDVVAGLRGRLADLDASTPAGYEQVRAGLAEVRTLRTGVERSRKELVRSAVDWQHAVNAEAKRVTQMLQEIERPLKEKKQAVDQEKERIRMEKIEAQRREEEERRRAEEERLEAERKAEEERLAAEREAVEAERRKLAEERAEFERKQREQREEEERLQREKEEAERKEREEAERKEREAAEKKAEEERLKRDAAERAARAKDMPKLQEFLDALAEVQPPEHLETAWASEIASAVMESVGRAQAMLNVQAEHHAKSD